MRLRRSKFELKTPEQFERMRAAGLVVADALAATKAAVAPGVTTLELDKIAETVIRDAGATPSFLGYNGFTGSICVSVNEEIVHGIPGSRVLEEGDLVSIDCGAIVDGWHGDSAITVGVGQLSAADQALSDITEAAMWAGLKAARAGNHLGDIGAAAQAVVEADAHPYGIVVDYVGHGIGSQMHMDPNVPNVGTPGHGPELVVGMALAIEPMITMGSADSIELEDGWTVVTEDGQRASHWEHTVAITADGPWVTTSPEGVRL